MIEQMLSDVMHAHDHEAPEPVSFVLPDRVVRRGRPWAVGLAASAVLAASVTTYVVSRGSDEVRVPVASALGTVTTQAPAPSCPASIPGLRDDWRWVPPAAPASGQRLVPLGSPSAVVACKYSDTRLGSVEIHGDLTALDAELAGTPKAGLRVGCNFAATSAKSQKYLLGVVVDGATTWVAVPADPCGGGVTNGVFESNVNLGSRVARWFDAGRWTAAAPCQSRGRLGQENRMVPDHPVSVTVCGTTPATSSDAAVIAALVMSLNSVPTTEASAGASCPPGDATFTTLQFGYASGPGVRVTFSPQCTPHLTNQALTGAIPPGLLQLVAAIR